MADKGFTIQNLLPLGTSLNIPPFLGQNEQMTPENVIRTQEIPSVRIHVETSHKQDKEPQNLEWSNSLRFTWSRQSDVEYLLFFK